MFTYERGIVHINFSKWNLIPFTHTHGQWWSIFSTHIPHTLQWWARSGLITIHLSQYLNEPFIVLKLNWNWKLESYYLFDIWSHKMTEILRITGKTYRLLMGKSFANTSKILFWVFGFSACSKRSISELGIRNCWKEEKEEEIIRFSEFSMPKSDFSQPYIFKSNPIVKELWKLPLWALYQLK